MKRALAALALLFFANFNGFAQESGNQIYGNQGYYNQQRRQPQTDSGTLGGNANGYGSRGYAVEASVLLNQKPDAFVVVFGVNEEAPTANASNEKVNRKITDFTKSLSGLGVQKNDTFVDFITQNRIYDYTLVNNVAREKLSGFETKKTIAARYKNREMFEKIVAAAADNEIFDLIKVDYVVSDFDAVRARLFDEAVKIINAKREKYMNSFGIKTLAPVGLANEKYDAFYPSESYQRYQAFEAGDAETSYSSSGGRVTKRKNFTFFYQPFDAGKFDGTINQIGVEPVVQFTVYLRMDYETAKSKEN